MTQSKEHLKPGQRVSVTQQIPHGGAVWATHTVGEVVRLEQRNVDRRSCRVLYARLIFLMRRGVDMKKTYRPHDALKI